MTTWREIHIVRIASDPVALFHSGVGDLLVPADSVIGPIAQIAVGLGELVNIPDLQEMINGTAERVDIELEGVTETALRLALEDAPSVRGADVHIGRMDLDADQQQAAPVEWEANFQARSLGVSRPKVEGLDNPRRTITLTIARGDTVRSRAPNSYFTDSDQRRRSADDAIFDHVGQISAGTSRRFGPSDA